MRKMQQMMLQKYPSKVIDELTLQANTPYQYSITELEEIRDKYKALAKEMGYKEDK
jgi:rRNA maturation endonuclease Nob1